VESASVSTQLNSSLLKNGSQMAKRETVNINKKIYRLSQCSYRIWGNFHIFKYGQIECDVNSEYYLVCYIISAEAF